MLILYVCIAWYQSKIIMLKQIYAGHFFEVWSFDKFNLAAELISNQWLCLFGLEIYYPVNNKVYVKP